LGPILDFLASVRLGYFAEEYDIGFQGLENLGNPLGSSPLPTSNIIGHNPKLFGTTSGGKRR
jgi:hypothetical protein